MLPVNQKVDLEMDAVQIVANLIWFGNDPGLIWTERIIARVASKPLERVQAALQWLRKKSYVVTHKGSYIVTTDGQGYYDAAKRNPNGMINLADMYRWKSEVLSGMVEQRSKKSKFLITEKSKLENAVLPSSQPTRSAPITPEQIMVEYESRQRALLSMARRLDLTIEELRTAWNDDKIRICTAGGDSHFGLFDTGKTVCSRCAKKRGRK